VSKGATYPVLKTVATGVCARLTGWGQRCKGGSDKQHRELENEWKGSCCAGSLADISKM